MEFTGQFSNQSLRFPSMRCASSSTPQNSAEINVTHKMQKFWIDAQPYLHCGRSPKTKRFMSGQIYTLLAAWGACSALSLVALLSAARQTIPPWPPEEDHLM
jgi:hypothetical protein